MALPSGQALGRGGTTIVGTTIVGTMIVGIMIVGIMIVDDGMVDKRAREPRAYHSEPASAGGSDPEPLRITVILTTFGGTLAALRAAANLARGLRAEIALLVAEVVYIRYPVEHPPVGSSFFERLGTALAEELDLEGDEVDLEIHFCRDHPGVRHHLRKPLRPAGIRLLVAPCLPTKSLRIG